MRRVVNGLEYELVYKNIKNVNLRVKADGSVAVSAPYAVGVADIDRFVLSRSAFIEKSRAKLRDGIDVPDFSEARDAIYSRLYGVLRKMYGRFCKYGFKMPSLKIRKMKSQWGNCRPAQGVITLNSYLYALPEKYVEYVAAHELAHMVEANHSRRFYSILDSVMPDHRAREREMRRYVIDRD